ncbi:calcineurin catalytic subunit A SKDI_12G4600 [Saccharomyces kudriavzevii IFO 1802]|uniref:Serine/threonine-protein phosphatase n=1 Tax=Saccharomyces kudriavzevii (strain ATCC MYA-4449 / AS 2.2408 / CBS 8840 / NBRC 1802 / NCYC 2889) TaxID=226230 RepID=A0AA35NK59_SACK1|nr:uncharacterized protein SKDI_12G4600 [Saccharomyces kudriavzevii IFO 1802]CAI4047172.1 hypothetical protein SKDI_12G4600 [Saccharomyces kudriavzevii IFO 1802]
MSKDLNSSSRIKIIKPKDSYIKGNQEVDLTKYALENGNIISTKDRPIPSVPAIRGKIPSNEEVFHAKTGLPNHSFLREHFVHEGRLSKEQAIKILNMSTVAFEKEPNLLKLKAPITICGDIHGQYYDLLKLFEIGGDPANIDYLFLGDYVDRGAFSFECLIYLYALKLNHLGRFWMLRGNHECRHLTSYFTFKNEMLHKYDMEVYDACCRSFNTLPLAALMNGQYFCVHGGISPELKSVEDVNKVNRFREIPSRGLMCDLLWADPVEEYDDARDGSEFDPSEDDFVPNSLRGCSFAFTFKASCNFLKANGLLSIIRAHEAQDAGYRMYKNNKVTGFPSLITMFSAPNYLDTYHNKAAVLKYEENVMNIRQFHMSPHPYWLPDFMDVFTWSLPFVGEKVTNMLVSILNICSEEELDPESEVQAVGTGTKTDSDSTKATSAETAGKTSSAILEDESRRKALRNKILAIAKVSRMFSVLREESDKVEYLKTMNAGILPRGALSRGSEGLNETLSTFEKARKEDLINEKLPPSLSDVEQEKIKYYEKILKRAEGK